MYFPINYCYKLCCLLSCLFTLNLFWGFFDTSVGIKLTLAAYLKICISFDIRNSQMTSNANIDLRGI